MNRHILKYLAVLMFIAIAQDAAADTIFNSMDAQGRKQGFWRKHHSNGKIAYNAFFVNNYVRGDLVRYHENGKKMAVIQYFDGMQPAYAKLYSTEGKLIAEGRYIAEGIKFNTWKYYSDGKLSMQETYDSIGKHNGEEIYFYPSGKIFERRHFQNGLQTGLFQQLFENGQPILEMMYRSGKPHGKMRYYYSSNQIRIDGQYENGIRTGEWVFYDMRGKIERRTTYVDGVASDQDEIDQKQAESLRQMEQYKGVYEEPEALIMKQW
jgi:antitoxin component YwqK of YwqJK toxin-antitoxin module